MERLFPDPNLPPAAEAIVFQNTVDVLPGEKEKKRCMREELPDRPSWVKDEQILGLVPLIHNWMKTNERNRTRASFKIDPLDAKRIAKQIKAVVDVSDDVLRKHYIQACHTFKEGYFRNYAPWPDLDLFLEQVHAAPKEPLERGIYFGRQWGLEKYADHLLAETDWSALFAPLGQVVTAFRTLAAYDLYVLIKDVKTKLYTGHVHKGSSYDFPSSKLLYLIHNGSFGNPFYNVSIGSRLVYPYLMLRFQFIGRKEEFEKEFQQLNLDVPAGDEKSVMAWTQKYMGLFVERLARERLLWTFEKGGFHAEYTLNVEATEEDAIQACQGWKKAWIYDDAFRTKMHGKE